MQVDECATQIDLDIVKSELDTCPDGLYLVDYAYAVLCDSAIGSVTARVFAGTTKFGSDSVLSSLLANKRVSFSAADDWHSVIRTLFALCHPHVHTYLKTLTNKSYLEIIDCWSVCLQGHWYSSPNATAMELRKQAFMLAKSCFVDFVQRSQ